ncbi:MAG: hypothetical protein E7435_03655 [Ruminococcaceae bacterium]|nr:hypothetical protein [Oscillospiraceae bacterium]
MDRKQIADRIVDWVKRYKYVFIIVVAGVLLMLLPSSTSKDDTKKETVTVSTEKTMEVRLTEALSQIRGAGRVQVMLTEAAGAETIYKTNEHISAGTDNSTTQKDTVTVTDENRAENGLITQVIPPRYQGALIVCQGADDPLVRLAITEAVASLTGLKTDKITIVRMK